jgi:hypothetical protein
MFDNAMAKTVSEYLGNGGFVYLDGADALGADQANNTTLLNLLGLQSASDGGLNKIDDLAGQPDALTQDLVFSGNSQVSNVYIDRYVPSPSNGIAAFNESNYGAVAVQSSVPGGRRSFCFSYAIAYLVDEQYPNTRDELMHRILNFFDMLTAVPETAGASEDGFIIYPNPIHDELTVEIAGDHMSAGNLTIYGIDGRQIISEEISNRSIKMNLSGILPGIYLVELRTGSRVFIQKLLKK